MVKMLTGFVVAGAVILGGWWYFGSDTTAPGAETAPTENTGTAPTESVQAGTFSGSFDDLAARGGDWKCTFTSKTEMGDAVGTVYVSGKNIRGDFSMIAPVIGKVDSYMIADSEFTYAWSSMLPQGFKAKRADGGVAAETDTKTADTMVNPKMAMNYNCEPHTADAALFVVPSNVTFKDLN